jgi:hypothetical protein
MEQTGFNEIQLSILRQYQDAYRKADSVERRRKLKLVVKKFARMEKKIYKDLTEEEKQEIRSVSA